MASNREHLTAISINRGVIMLIEPNGTVGQYRQRGIDTLTSQELISEVRSGHLIARWGDLPELPKNYSISFEDPSIMGRAFATYWLVRKKNRDARKQKKGK